MIDPKWKEVLVKGRRVKMIQEETRYDEGSKL